MTHSQWMHRCAIEHERDAQGLKLKESWELTKAIAAQLALGVDVTSMLTIAIISPVVMIKSSHFWWQIKRPGLAALLCITWETYLASEAQETESMHTFILHWLAWA
jgi:hypothetical protein